MSAPPPNGLVRKVKRTLPSPPPEEAHLPLAGQAAPPQLYAASLLQRGPDAFLKKIGEEAAEVIMAAKDAQHGSAPQHLVNEMADLWFHCMVALAHLGVSAQDVVQELARREGLSGLEEKARRGGGKEHT